MIPKKSTHHIVVYEHTTGKSKTISFNSKKSPEELRILFKATAEGA